MAPPGDKFCLKQTQRAGGQGNGRQGQKGTNEGFAVLCKNSRTDFCVLLSQRRTRIKAGVISGERAASLRLDGQALRSGEGWQLRSKLMTDVSGDKERAVGTMGSTQPIRLYRQIQHRRTQSMGLASSPPDRLVGGPLWPPTGWGHRPHQSLCVSSSFQLGQAFRIGRHRSALQATGLAPKL